MKKAIIPIALTFLLACNNNERTTSETEYTQDTAETSGETISSTLDSACYVRTTGKNNKDTFALKLIVQGNRVTGKLKYLYYEKDWRIGNLTGTRKGDIVNAKWVYIQEGQLDSTDVSFRLDGNNAYQKSSFYDNVTGREIMSDTGSYIEQYPKVDCAAFPKYDFDFGL